MVGATALRLLSPESGGGYGLLDVQITPLYRWLRAEHGYAHYSTGGIDAEAVKPTDSEFDLSGHDIVMTVMPSTTPSGVGAAGSSILGVEYLDASVDCVQVGVDPPVSRSEPVESSGRLRGL